MEVNALLLDAASGKPELAAEALHEFEALLVILSISVIPSQDLESSRTNSK